MTTMKKCRFGAFLLAASLLMPGLASCASQDVGGTPDTADAEEKDTTVYEEKETVPYESKDYSASGIAVGGAAAGEKMSEDCVRHTADFGLSLLKLQAPGENTMLSPLSILYALGMTANGAAGNTLSQMEDVLFGGTEADTANRYFLDYTQSLPEGTAGVSLDIANSIWFNDRLAAFSVNTEFLSKNTTYYGAGVYGRDFARPETLTEVNQWVSDNTDGMIPSILNRLSGDDLMLLVNTVLFDGKWAQSYGENDIRKGTFAAYGGAEQTDVDYLCSTEKGYFTLGEGKGFVRSYAERYSFVGILPDEGVDVYDYLASLDGESLVDAIGNPTVKKTYVRIPELTFDSEPEVKKSLEALGLTDAFCANAADFSRLGTFDGGNIYVSNVIQKTRIELTRDGTKAAAATMVSMVATSAGPNVDPPMQIFLTRPFVFAITDNETGLVLFCGVVTEIE